MKQFPCKFLIPLIFFIAPKMDGALYGQKQGQAAIDSLLQQLSNAKEDTNKVNVLNEMSRNSRIMLKYDDGVKYALLSLELATKLNWQRGIGNACNFLGNNYLAESEFQKAWRCFIQAEDIFKKLNNKTGLASVAVNFGFYYSLTQPNTLKCLEYHKKALEIFKELGNKDGMARCFLNIGNILFFMGYYPETLENYLECLKLAEETGNKQRIAGALLSIGNVYSEQNDHTKALEYYFKSLKIEEDLKNKNEAAIAVGNIGFEYYSQGNYSNALEYYFKSFKINKDPTILGHIGEVYCKKKNYALSIAYETRELQIIEKIGTPAKIAETDMLFDIGVAYITMLEDTTNLVTKTKKSNMFTKDTLPVVNIPLGRTSRLQNAIFYLKRSADTAKEIRYSEAMQNCYEYLTKAYRLKGDYKTALEYAGKAHAIKDSIFSKENNEKIVKQGMKYEFEKTRVADSVKTANKERMISLEFKRQRSYMYMGIAVVLLLLAFSGISIYNYNRRKKLSFQKKVAETEMTALRAQMNPHFIFNALNSIHTYIQDNNNKVASSYLLNFSALTRLILENSMHQFIPLADEMQAMELYLSLEQLRLGSKLNYEITIAADIDRENTLIPPLILQPFIENAILHGLQDKENAGSIKVEINRQEQMMHCIITDNGAGRKKAGEKKPGAFAAKKESLGMRLTEQRIAIINQTEKANAHVSVTDVTDDGRPAGVRVELVLPLKVRF